MWGASLGMTGHLEVATATEGSFFLRRIRPSPVERNCPLHSDARGNGKGKLVSGNWKLEIGNCELEIRNWTLEAGSHRGRRSKTNPMELKNFISTEYKEKARNKPNVVMHNDINALRGFLASFPRNMYDSRLRFHSRFGTCYMLSMGYNQSPTVLGKYGSFAAHARSRSDMAPRGASP